MGKGGGGGGYAASEQSGVSGKSGDVSSVGGSEHGSGLEKRGSDTSSQEGGLAGISRRGLLEWIFEAVWSVPKVPKIEGSWKLQLLVALYQQVVWFMYALHPLWGWNFSYR